uniref:MucR family transcriptional regulator n=1 Tax=Methylobacterium sp. B34 TaxID=95563 RepID=UPI0005B2DF98|nr:MucR family transcriptional regulator [Methylobacterium sp. B34]
MDDNTSVAGSTQSDLIEFAADIVSAYVANNSVPVAELPGLLSGIHVALVGLGAPAASVDPKVEKLTPGQIRKSITPDALISFIDGKPYKTLKRHLTGNGLTMEEYRQRYGLPVDYPSTAANYSAMRAEFARANGLGQQRKAAAKVAEVTETITDAPKARGRKKAAEPAAAPTEKPARARKPKKAASAE